jgi:DNA-binding HxlR family transcriptional regulator
MRTYGEACTMAHALDLIGERWALLVVRELLLGPKRFTDLQRSLPRANPRILAQRLRDLTRAGVLRRHKIGPPVSSYVYEVTEWGADLEPAIMHLGRWGSRSPHLDMDADVSAVSAMLALKGRFDPAAAAGLTAQFAVHFGDDHFSVDVADGQIRITREPVTQPDAVIDTDTKTFAALLTKRLRMPDATDSRRLHLTGSAELVGKLFDAVHAPDSVKTSSVLDS